MPFSNKLIKKHENTEMLSGILFSLSFFFFNDYYLKNIKQ